MLIIKVELMFEYLIKMGVFFKKSQGEIFGVALLFVVIIVGVIIYSVFADMKGDEENLGTESKYKILAEGSLNSVLKMSTGCEVETNKDSLKDLINFCLEMENNGAGDLSIPCDHGIVSNACDYSFKVLDDTFNGLYNNENGGLAYIPYELSVTVPHSTGSRLHDKYSSNFGEYKYRDNVMEDQDDRRNMGFKKAPSGLISWATAQRNIDFELYLYYR